MNDPYLSVVVTSRNDNHGGTLLRRMQIFADCLIAQCKRHNLSAELIVVEWNPPADRPPLASALRWPADPGPCAIRFITVPPAIHARYKYAAHLPLYQMIAKNVGIRRARGQFILATNIDVILNDELAAFIARRGLERGRMYRIDRTDVDALVPEGAPLTEVLDYCRNHLLRVNARDGTFPIGPDGQRALAPVDVADHKAIVSLGAGWYDPQQEPNGKPYRWVSNDAEIWLKHPADSPKSASTQYMTIDLEGGPAAGSTPFLLRAIDSEERVLVRRHVLGRCRISFPIRLSAARLEKILLHADHLTGGTLPANIDPRRLTFMVRRIEISDDPPDSAAATPLDIAGEGILLSENWSIPEMDQGVPFRWLDTNTDLWVEPGEHRSVEIDLEPGPSLNREPFVLQVERSGESFLEYAILRRQTIRIPLPSREEAGLLRIKLRIDGPRLAIPGDARILNARVFNVRLTSAAPDDPPASAARSDIGEMGDSAAYGRGWHGPEWHEDHWFRWADNNATLWLAADASAGRPAAAELRINPGPSLGNSEAELQALDESGRIAGRLERASGVMRLRLDRPLSRFTLRIESPALPVEADSRILNFRLDHLTITASPPAQSPAMKPRPSDPSSKTFAGGATSAMPAFLHTNACGDFTLLHRDHWFELRGYAEWDVFSLNIDSLFCFTAHHGGAPETILEEPMRLYHIEHNVGSGWTPEGQRLLIERIEKLGIQHVHWSEVAHLGATMNKYDAPMLFCREDWGLADERLPENTIGGD